MLLDLATVSFLAAGSLLLWLNIRNRPDDVVLTKFDNERLDIEGRVSSKTKRSFSSARRSLARPPWNWTSGRSQVR